MNVATCFAAEASETPKKVNVTIDEGDLGDPNGQYIAYKILDLTTSGSGDNTNYGYAFNDDFKKLLQEKSGKNDLEGVLDYIEGLKKAPAVNGVDAVRNFADGLFKDIMKSDELCPKYAKATDGTKLNIEQGYYIIAHIPVEDDWNTFIGLVKKNKTEKEEDELRKLRRKMGFQSGTKSGYSLVILDTAGQDNVTIKSKLAHPTIDKTTTEVNDSTGASTEGVKIADYDIGDMVPFRIECSIPKYYKNYKSYWYVIYDEISDSLDIEKNKKSGKFEFTVKIEGTHKADITKQFELFKVDGNDTGNKKTLYENVDLGHGSERFRSISGSSVYCFAPKNDNFDLKQVTNGDKLDENDKIVITYNAKLNGKAVIDINVDDPTEKVMNGNIARLEYSSNAYDAEGGITQFTPPEEVIIYTYRVKIEKLGNKEGEEPTGPKPDPIPGYDDGLLGQPLEGAIFELHKYNKKAGKYEFYRKQVIPNDPHLKHYHVFTGLDAGKYKFIETKAPDGYSKHSPIFFELKSNILDNQETDSEGKKSIKEYKYNLEFIEYDANGEKVENPTLAPLRIADFVMGPVNPGGGGSDPGDPGGSEPPWGARAARARVSDWEIIDPDDYNPSDLDPGDLDETGQKEKAKYAGTYIIQVVNITRNELPSTGGIGRKIFYLVGSALIIGSGVLLFSRRKMAAPDEY